MEHIVHQDHGPVEGVDGTYLVGQRGVVRVRLDGAAAQVRLVDLVGTQRLGDGVGHDYAPEDLAVGHADVRAEDAGRYRFGGHAVAGGDVLEQPVVDDPRRQTQHQRTGLKPGQGRL